MQLNNIYKERENFLLLRHIIVLNTYDSWGNSSWKTAWLKAWWKGWFTARQTPCFHYTANFPRHFAIFHLQIM